MSADNEADIFIYGEIASYEWDESDTTASNFKKELDSLGDVSTINLYVNSPGGSVFEGVAIYNMLKRHKAKVNAYVDALAASISSVIIMSADNIFMPKNSMLMIHNPWTVGMGNSSDFRKLADDLDRVGNSSKQSYLQKAGDKLTDEKLQEMLDNETWLSADEALENGLCDFVIEENEMVASISGEYKQRYKNIPKQIIEQKPKETISAKEMAERKKIAKQAKFNEEYIDDILGGI